MNSSNEVTNAYACGVKDDVPFCIEGELDSTYGGTLGETVYAANKNLLQSTDLYNITCDEYTEPGYSDLECGSWDNVSLSSYTESTDMLKLVMAEMIDAL